MRGPYPTRHWSGGSLVLEAGQSPAAVLEVSRTKDSFRNSGLIMAPRGPKPKAKNAIAPGPMPSPPVWMLENVRAVQLWNQYGPVLNKLGLLESLDAVGFSLLCEAIDAYLIARDQLGDEELVVTVGESFSPQQNPLVSIVRQQTKAIRELLIEFGMTPTGRIRLTGSTSVQPVDVAGLDPLEELAKKMNAGVPPAAKPTTPARRQKAAKKAGNTKQTRKR